MKSTKAHLEARRRYYEKNKEKIKADGRRRYYEKIDERREYGRKYYNAKIKPDRTAANEKMRIDRKNKKEEYRYRRIKKIYGLTKEDEQRMLESQNNLCALCFEPFSNDWGGERPVIDHDHKTGMIRGIIHSKCNAGIGIFADNVHRLEMAIQYLNKSQETNSNLRICSRS